MYTQCLQAFFLSLSCSNTLNSFSGIDRINLIHNNREKERMNVNNKRENLSDPLHHYRHRFSRFFLDNFSKFIQTYNKLTIL